MSATGPSSSDTSATDAAQTAFADAFMAGLVAGGVRDLVVSPGSRSTALLLAATRSAAGAALRVHPIHDERAGGFFALGLARTTGAPTALLCSSGTAAGHYLPAVMEASATGLPLVVISADRPPELHGSGANQTIEQRHLFGEHVRAFVDLGLADGRAITLRAAARRGAQVAARTRWPDPGPVHVNAPARKPLERAADVSPPPPPPAVSLPSATLSVAELAPFVQALGAAERPLLVAGPAPLDRRRARDAVRRLAQALDAPLLADATSQLATTMPAHDLAAAHLDPDLVLQIGRPPIGSRIERWSQGRRRLVLAERGWPDPASDAERIAFGDVVAALETLAEAVPARPRPAWAHRAHALASAIESQRETILGRDLEAGFHEGHIARTALQAWPSEGLIVLGNSLPVRHADLWGRPPAAGVLHQRGVSGIDGLVAGAAGAVVGAGAPTLLMLGDVSFLHDIGGLATTRHCTSPLVVLVVDNDGGRIFERLPVHGALDDASFERLFAMPPRVDVAHAAATFGLAHVRVESVDGLRAALRDALDDRGCPTVVHAVAQAERGRAADERLGEAIASLELEPASSSSRGGPEAG